MNTALKIFFSVVLFLNLCSCGGGLVKDDRPRPRSRGDRNGDPDPDVDLPEEVADANFFDRILKNCQGNTLDTLPDNDIDIVVQQIPWAHRFYGPGKLRVCIKSQLRKANEKICEAQEKLEEKMEQARDRRDKVRAETSLYKLEEIKYKFNERLYKAALKFDKESSKAKKRRKETDSILGDVFHIWTQQETEALRDIFDVESYSECSFYVDGSNDYGDDEYYRNVRSSRTGGRRDNY